MTRPNSLLLLPSWWLLIKHVYVATEKGHWKKRSPMWSTEAAVRLPGASLCLASLHQKMMDGPFLREHGELDKIHLKQLRWIDHHITCPTVLSKDGRSVLSKKRWVPSPTMEMLPCCVADMTSQWTRCLAGMRAVGALLAWPFHLCPWWGWQRAKRPWAEFWQCVEVKAAFVPQVIWISSVLPSKSLPSMMTPTGVHQKEKGAKKQTCLKVWMSTFVPCDVLVCSLHLGWPMYQRVYIYLGQLCRGQQHRRLLSARGCDAARGPLIDSAWASLADVPFQVVQDLCFVNLCNKTLIGHAGNPFFLG